MSVPGESPLTTLAFCWRVERRDGAGLALTSHDSIVMLDGVAHLPAPGILPSAITRKLGLEPHAGEVTGALTSDALSETDLSLGRWDGARLALTAVDWEALETPPLQLLSGELGEVAVDGDSYSAELRGAAWRLDEPICPTTSPECRAELGDKQCRVDLAGRTSRATVTGAENNILTLEPSPDERFLFGRLRYLRGANCGVTTTVLSVSGSTVTLRDIPRMAVEAGCTVELREGCDKRLSTCASRFQNAINFRGEPHLPGNDLLTRYPGQ